MIGTVIQGTLGVDREQDNFDRRDRIESGITCTQIYFSQTL